MFKSLRWKLQFFYSALLATIIVCSGSIFYYQVWRSTFAEVDRGLEVAALYLDVIIRSFPPPILQGLDAPPMPPRSLRPDGTAPPPPRPHRSKEQFLDDLYKVPLNMIQIAIYLLRLLHIKMVPKDIF